MPSTFEILPDRLARRLDEMAAEFDALEKQLLDPAVSMDHKKVRDLSIKRAALAPVVEGYRQYRKLLAEAAELREAIAGTDADLAALAREELPDVESRAAALIEQVKARLVTSEDQKVGSVMLEVRAGTGGDEAALWARDLLEMYQKYAIRRGWKFEALDVVAETDAGGIRSAVVSVEGEGVWVELAFEAGVHSVKRVPATEAAGRVHTSTATVAVLPEAEDVEVKIDWANEVEEFATRAQGPGGQNVNKVETAWQIHHKPTGIIIKMMEAKSQQQNRDRARRLLMARLHEAERQRQHAQRSAARRGQIGSGDRSEKIRTYRYKDSIVADERLPGEYAIRDIMSGDLARLMKDLVAQETARRLAEL
ncbi:MAG: PCRF domain-containing protein [Phycisphaerales bacterium]